MQDVVAVISLRAEDEIALESLTDDLRSALTYPFYPDELDRNLQYLRRSGLISVNWQKRTIKREKSLSEYVKNDVIATETWSKKAADWQRINILIQNKHNTSNKEYQSLFLQNNEKERLP
jgi:hypothetical protein